MQEFNVFAEKKVKDRIAAIEDPAQRRFTEFMLDAVTSAPAEPEVIIQALDALSETHKAVLLERGYNWETGEDQDLDWSAYESEAVDKFEAQRRELPKEVSQTIFAIVSFMEMWTTGLVQDLEVMLLIKEAIESGGVKLTPVEI